MTQNMNAVSIEALNFFQTQAAKADRLHGGGMIVIAIGTRQLTSKGSVQPFQKEVTHEGQTAYVFLTDMSSIPAETRAVDRAKAELSDYQLVAFGN
jgi:hypothetical protein